MHRNGRTIAGSASTGEQAQLAVQDWNGVTSYGYDNADRQTSVRYPTDQALTYTVDAVGNREVLSDPTGLTTFSHDAAALKGARRCDGIHNPTTSAPRSPGTRSTAS